MSDYQVEILIEPERECGHRHSGEGGVGLYLVCPPGGTGCDRLPFPLMTADEEPIKHFRGLKEIDPSKMFPDRTEPILAGCMGWCGICPMGGMRQNYGLLKFVGENNYTVESFQKEAARLGVSQRISDVPNSFIFGQHYIYLAHPAATTWLNPMTGEMEPCPAVFKVFKPTLDLVIDDPNNIPERAKRLKDKYGDQARIVKIVPV